MTFNLYLGLERAISCRSRLPGRAFKFTGPGGGYHDGTTVPTANTINVATSNTGVAIAVSELVDHDLAKSEPNRPPLSGSQSMSACGFDVRDASGVYGDTDSDSKDIVTAATFLNEFVAVRRPVLLKGMLRGTVWDGLRDAWSRSKISSQHPGIIFNTSAILFPNDDSTVQDTTAESVAMSISEYIAYMDALNDADGAQKANSKTPITDNGNNSNPMNRHCYRHCHCHCHCHASFQRECRLPRRLTIRRYSRLCWT